MSLMSTYGTLARKGRVVTRPGVPPFQYPEVVHNHYTYRDAVDNHNKNRMYPIALEEAWKTRRWPLRVFQFLLDITEVNARRAMIFFYGQHDKGQIHFRRQLADCLINNEHLPQEPSPRKSPQKRQGLHSYFLLPPKSTFRHGKIAKTKTATAQLKCIECGRRCHSCCLCEFGVVRCPYCIVSHVEESAPWSTT